MKSFAEILTACSLVLSCVNPANAQTRREALDDAFREAMLRQLGDALDSASRADGVVIADTRAEPDERWFRSLFPERVRNAARQGPNPVVVVLTQSDRWQDSARVRLFVQTGRVEECRAFIMIFDLFAYRRPRDSDGGNRFERRMVDNYSMRHPDCRTER